MDKQIILKTYIKREKGWIYFTGTSEEGNITLMKARQGKRNKE